MLNKYVIIFILGISFSQNFIYDSDDWYVIKNPGMIYSITEGPFNVYFGCENGIYTYNKFDQNIEYDYQLNRGLDHEYSIHYIHYDYYSDQIWVLNDNGLYFKNPIFNDYKEADFNLDSYSLSALGSIDQYIILEYLSEYIVINSFSGSRLKDYSSIDFSQINWSSSYFNYDKDIDLSKYYSDNWLIGFKKITDQYGNEEIATVFYEDKDLNFWYGTNQGKLIKGYKYSNRVEVLSIGPHSNIVTSMSQSQDGNWYLSEGRFRREGYRNEQNYYKGANPFISIWNEYDNNWFYFNESDFSKINNPDINCHLNINDDYLVLGTMDGIIIISNYNPKDFKVVSRADGLRDRAVFDLEEYDGQLFIMTPESISIYSMNYNVITNQNILDSFNLRDPEILDINISNDNLFFSTKAGLFKYSIVDKKVEKISNQIFKQISFYDKKIIGVNDNLWLVDYINNNEKILYSETCRNFKIIDNYIWLNLVDKVKLINLDSVEQWIYDHNDGLIDMEIFDIKDDGDWVYFLTNHGVIFYNWSNYHF